MTTYTVPSNKNYPRPRISGSVGIMFLLLFLISSISSSYGQELKTYTVYPNHTSPNPNVTGSTKDTLFFPFILTKDWAQIANDTLFNDSQKLVGWSDLFGSNSIRLSVRRGANNYMQQGLVPICYLHISGKTTYPEIRDLKGKRFLILFDSLYYCKIYKIETGHRIELYRSGSMIGFYNAPVFITFFKRFSGIWIERGNKPTPYLIRTKVG